MYYISRFNMYYIKDLKSRFIILMIVYILIIIYNCICMLIAYYIILYILGVYKYIQAVIIILLYTFEGIRHGRIYTFRKKFDCKKCPVHLRWYRLSNITDYSFHTLWTFLTVKNVTLTWYRLPNITVYSFHTLSTFLFF